MSDTKLKGPYTTDINVFITNGETRGQVTVSMTMGRVPTQQDIDDAIKVAEAELQERGFRLMNKVEFFNAQMADKLGATEEFACPGGEEWDA